MKAITLLTLILALSSCSFSDSNREEVASVHDDLEFSVDTMADHQPANTDFQVEEQKVAENIIDDDGPVPGQEPTMAVPEEPSFKEFAQQSKPVAPVVAEVAQEVVDAPVKIEVEHIDQPVYGQMEHYRVQKGDTLMMVAFKLYGDYRKWKDLKSWNKDKKHITEGVELKYYMAENKFGQLPSGLPYLVKTGDTLQIVSMDKYGTTRKWKNIYENNRPLIRNPNLIFAGFTLYYLPLRDLASRPK